MSSLALIDRDPAELGFPPTLPIEIALREQTPREICEAYNISKSEWADIRVNPVFIRALTDAVELLKKEGMTFKIKARLQSEELLKTSWALIHSNNDQVSPAVKADLIKFTIKAAGLDASQEQKLAASAGGQQNALQININLG
jgi:hypothetical protein